MLTTFILNLGLLFYFKYLYFISFNLNSFFNFIALDFQIPLLELILPFGISFYTFETISYTVDVYRGILKPERRLQNYLLFITFFPKLVAGPIQRASEFLPQIDHFSKFQLQLFLNGIQRLIYGLFLKVVLADNISPLVDIGFSSNIDLMSAIDVWTLSFLFGFQIYFDFSAYSHIAIGVASMLGFIIPENFDFPYVATSYKEFWKRWHISLSSWIRDYLYLPLLGVKVIKSSGKDGIILDGIANSQSRKNKVLFVTWMIMGFWHGANWTFLLWGVLHAFLIFVERFFKLFNYSSSFFKSKIICWLFTIPFLMLTWIPFRADNLSTSILMLKKVFNPFQYSHLSFRENTYIVTFLIFVSYYVFYLIEFKASLFKFNNRNLKDFLEVVKFAFILFLIIVFLRPVSQFIYFQF